LNELRGCWLFGIILAVALYIVGVWITGISWDWMTLGILGFGLAWIVVAWVRRYPRR
jgi:hypothetical protein